MRPTKRIRVLEFDLEGQAQEMFREVFPTGF